MELTVIAGATIWMTILLAAIVFFATKARTNAVRLLAVDAVTLILVAVLTLFAATTEQAFYLDAALVLALVSFIGTVAAARSLAGGRVL